MPGPTEDTLSLEFDDDGTATVFLLTDVWPYPNGTVYHKHRYQRAREVQRQLNKDGRACKWCGEMIPLMRPTTTLYCTKGCASRAWWKRRKVRNAIAWTDEEYQQAIIRLQLGEITGAAAVELRTLLEEWHSHHGGIPY